MSSRRLGPARAYPSRMPLGVRCLAICAVVACAISPRLAHAQSDDTLPTLDDSEAPETALEPVAPVPPVVVVDPSQKPARPAVGPIRAHPNLSFDLGAGLALVGWKVGLRARYLLLKGPVTPFIGVGVLAASGFGSEPIQINNQDDDPDRVPLNVKILPSTWLQYTAGIDWVSPRGFTLIGAVGWASVLGEDPVQIITGTPTHDEEAALNALFRSNIVMTIALGYSFR